MDAAAAHGDKARPQWEIRAKPSRKACGRPLIHKEEDRAAKSKCTQKCTQIRLFSIPFRAVDQALESEE
jgi:hypothetical protein